MTIDWENIGQEELRDWMKRAEDKKVRDKAFSSYDFSKAGEYELRDLMEFAEDKKVKRRAKEELERREIK